MAQTGPRKAQMNFWSRWSQHLGTMGKGAWREIKESTWNGHEMTSFSNRKLFQCFLKMSAGDNAGFDHLLPCITATRNSLQAQTCWIFIPVFRGWDGDDYYLHFTNEGIETWGGFPGGPVIKNPPAMQDMRQDPWVWSLGREDPLKEEMSTHKSIVAWEIPWTEQPGRLQFMGSQSWTWLSNWAWDLRTWGHKLWEG